MSMTDLDESASDSKTWKKKLFIGSLIVFNVFIALYIVDAIVTGRRPHVQAHATSVVITLLLLVFLVGNSVLLGVAWIVRNAGNRKVGR